MQIPTGISEEELKVFLQEADEQVQVLDEDIVLLEKDSGNLELMQEIFRAAHTLKGSSAMLGHGRLTEVAHSMESLLDRLRKSQIQCSAGIIDALLRGTDAIRSLKDELSEGAESGVSTEAIIDALEAAGTTRPPTSIQEPATDAARTDSALAATVQSALASGEISRKISISIDPASPWAAVRMFQAIHEIEALGTVAWSSPTLADIEAEHVGSTLDMVLISHVEEREVRAALADLQDLVQVRIEPFSPCNGSSHAAVSDGDTQTHAVSPTEAKPDAHNKGKGSQTIKVDVAMLDKFMDLVGELVIERSRVNQLYREFRQQHGETEGTRALNNASLNIYKVVDELHYGLMKARMLPISTVLNSLPRIVRDISRQLGKQTEIVIEGKETELDRAVLERLRDPLLHILRNAVDHGIETPEERMAAGKLPTGTLRVVASQEQDTILIKVSDDGRGIDAEKLKRAAVRNGVLTADEASQLSTEQALDLMFLSGLTTKERATEVSGRGVGMDIVKTNVEATGGSVAIESQPGQGTTIVLKLPLTLAIVQGFLVSSGNITYVIPILAVGETLRRKDASIHTVMGHEAVMYRDSVVPLRRIAALTGDRSGGSSEGGEYIVLVTSGGRTVALGVDGLLEPQEVVIKPLGHYLSMVKAISGATILGNGRVALILDVPTVVDLALGLRRSASDGGSSDRGALSAGSATRNSNEGEGT